jgi:hypothetical protein
MLLTNVGAHEDLLKAMRLRASVVICDISTTSIYKDRGERRPVNTVDRLLNSA